MSTQLARPETEDELYLARGEEVEAFRPVLTGDVFRDVGIPGVGIPHQQAMVISHPCTMRRGPALIARLQMLPVYEHQKVPLEQWPRGHFRVCPLPGLDPATPDVHFAASYEETGMVESTLLTPERRMACLTERGILLVQQRQIYVASRADIALALLEQASAHVFAEAELLEDWNRQLVPLRTAAGEDLVEALSAEAVAFDEFVSVPAEGEATTIRELLKTQHRRPHARRLVREEVRRRTEG